MRKQIPVRKEQSVGDKGPPPVLHPLPQQRVDPRGRYGEDLGGGIIGCLPLHQGRRDTLSNSESVRGG